MILGDKVAFFDCGSNFERICCPGCADEIPIQWWHSQIDTDFDGSGYKLAAYSIPYCDYRATLNNLIYDWPQGFSLFALEAMNPNVGELSKQSKNEFEKILGTPLRVIYQHIRQRNRAKICKSCLFCKR